MFLAPTGNPSSLRFGHPDVATEHTGLALTFLLPSPGRWSSGCGLRGGECTAAPRLGKSVRGCGEGNIGVRYRRQLTRDKDWVAGIAVAQFRRSGCLPAGSVRKGLPQLCERGAAILSCSDIRVPELCEGGSPAGAKEVYSAPAYPLHERGVHPASHPKTLEECSTHHTVVLT